MIDTLEEFDELDEANEELKRADHLIYITLKYTKTVDVIRSTIQRLISAFDFIILNALKHAKEKKLIKEIPVSPKMKTEEIKKVFKDSEKIIDFIDFYYLLKKIDKADYTAREEYRKNMTLVIKDEAIEVNIETLKNYFEKTKEFKKFIEDCEEHVKNWKSDEFKTFIENWKAGEPID